MNKSIFTRTLEEVVASGIIEFSVCPGSRNSPLVECLMESPSLVKHFWYEERSAAFFAVGRARASKRPVAIVTTSGSAVGELLPAVMEAYYTAVPIVLITADRPRRFRGTGAPQSVEQEGLFGLYTRFSQDLEGEEPCLIRNWDQAGPAHLNICLEDPKSYNSPRMGISLSQNTAHHKKPYHTDPSALVKFFNKSSSPLVIVSTLGEEEREPVIRFLQKMKAPIYCESGSGLRECAGLATLQLHMDKSFWELSAANGYRIDGVLRLGGVPVTRLWRDLEDRAYTLAECSISSVPFSGLSWGNHIQTDLKSFLPKFKIPEDWNCCDFAAWKTKDNERHRELEECFDSFPSSEPALFKALSKQIPPGSMVYLGNSLPVREWDLAATLECKNFRIETSRGVNGIDGQLSTFLGLCEPGRENWVILGDLTMLYDFAALWILQAMPSIHVKIVVINNHGGKLFARMYQNPVFQNIHDYDFEHFAKCWKIPYICLNGTAEPSCTLPKQAFVEICPDPSATNSFWKAYDAITAPLSV